MNLDRDQGLDSHESDTEVRTIMVGRGERRVLASLASLAGIGAGALLITLLSGGSAARGLQVAVFLTGFALGPGLALAWGAEALLTRLGLLSWHAYAVAGLVGGGFLSLLFTGARGTDPNGLLAGLVCGVAGALSYWAVLRPDQRDDQM